MSLAGIIVLLLAVMAAIVIAMVALTRNPASKQSHHATVSTNLRSLVASQRQIKESNKPGTRRPQDNLALAAAAESQGLRRRVTSSRLTLIKRLRYARWSITPIQWRALQLLAMVFTAVPAAIFVGKPIMFLALLMSPLILDGFLVMSIGRRFKAFDKDYPVMLLSFVSLLKTGMSTITALEAAAKGLDEGSLVRIEVEMLVERLRLGLTEEQSINAFGEDIAHPELELFVQGLLLSRRVGGTLSTTLERLAKQVRKRQQFRQQAIAAVGMERGSMWMIAAIMTLLLTYLAIATPELILPAFKNSTGKTMIQCGGMAVVIGFFWSRKVTNVKV